MSIQVTGNSRIDGATAEIAGHIRDGRVGSHVRYREQEHYDEAMRLRDEILAGTQEQFVAAATAAIDPLILLGNFIGNTFPGKVGYPAFDRCKIILDLRDSIAKAQALPPWRAAVNGTSKRPWFLIRGWGTESDRVPMDRRYHNGPSGKLVRYASSEAAGRAADKLNQAQAG